MADRDVVLDERAAPDHDVVADRAALTDAGLVADDDPAAEGRAGEDDGAGENRRSGADDEGRQRLPLCGRAPAEGRLLADDRVILDGDVLSQLRPLVDDGARGDGRHAGCCSSERWSCSSALTTATPSLAACLGSPVPPTSERKWRHSSRSGSSFATRGL